MLHPTPDCGNSTFTSNLDVSHSYRTEAIFIPKPVMCFEDITLVIKYGAAVIGAVTHKKSSPVQSHTKLDRCFSHWQKAVVER